jgi:probable phosphoglycerate mutase
MVEPTRIYLIRHGETEWSLSGQHSGRKDLPLTAHGEEEALAVGRILGGRKFDRVWCSTLQRARRTCELAGYLECAVLDPDLQEWDYGDCTGYTQEQIRERFPGWTIWDGPVPNGESIEQIAARARGVVDRIRSSGGSTALFAHGHFLRILATQWLELPPENGSRLALETASISILGYDTGYPAILTWNERKD